MWVDFGFQSSFDHDYGQVVAVGLHDDDFGWILAGGLLIYLAFCW